MGKAINMGGHREPTGIIMKSVPYKLSAKIEYCKHFHGHEDPQRYSELIANSLFIGFTGQYLGNKAKNGIVPIVFRISIDTGVAYKLVTGITNLKDFLRLNIQMSWILIRLSIELILELLVMKSDWMISSMV